MRRLPEDDDEEGAGGADEGPPTLLCRNSHSVTISTVEDFNTCSVPAWGAVEAAHEGLDA